MVNPTRKVIPIDAAAASDSESYRVSRQRLLDHLNKELIFGMLSHKTYCWILERWL